MRLALRPCPGGAAAAETRLEVTGADRTLIFSPGRPGGATLVLITGTDRPAPAPRQVFTPPASGGRELVLAPWPGPSAAPRFDSARLLAASR